MATQPVPSAKERVLSLLNLPEPVAESPGTPGPALSGLAEPPDVPRGTPEPTVAEPPPVVILPAAEIDEEFRFQDEPVGEPLPESQPLPDAKEELLEGLTGDARTKVENQISALLSMPRGRRMYEHFQVMRQLEAPAEQGGFGFRPTVEQIREWRSAHTDLGSMEFEFESGDPDRHGRFGRFWLTDGEGRVRPGAPEFAARLPYLLYSTDPALYSRAAGPVIHNLLHGPSGLYARAKSAASDEDRNRIMAHAQFVDDYVFGRGVSSVEPPGGVGDALKAERAEIGREKRRIADERVALHSARVNGFMSNALAEVGDHLTADVAAALDGLKGVQTDRTLAALQRDFADEMRASIARDPETVRELNMAEERAARSLRPEDAAAMVRAYRNHFRRAIEAGRTKFLTDVGASVKRRSEDRHRQLAAAAARTEVTASGVPVAQTVSTIPGRLQGETREAHMKRTVHGMLSTP